MAGRKQISEKDSYYYNCWLHSDYRISLILILYSVYAKRIFCRSAFPDGRLLVSNRSLECTEWLGCRGRFYRLIKVRGAGLISSGPSMVLLSRSSASWYAIAPSYRLHPAGTVTLEIIRELDIPGNFTTLGVACLDLHRNFVVLFSCSDCLRKLGDAIGW